MEWRFLLKIRQEITNKLLEIEQKEQVKILYAVESGSRAWGVESPDSDYDVRFVYVRPMKEYLKLQEQNDIIEWQLDEVFDMNGWDLKKTLIQFHKGNATLFEWANSPIIYKTTDEWNGIYKQCKHYFSEKIALYHYYGTANSTFKQYLQEDTVWYKKYIYALRPLLACRFIEYNHTIPPVCFENLLPCISSKPLLNEIETMLAVKAASDEKDLNPQLPMIQQYIQQELVRYKQLSKAMEDDRVADWKTLDDIFVKIVTSLETLFVC